jgi:3-hydroxyisobutyrate dehydrogenase-like beta-hydroxyacid dehydrogenase
VGVRPLSQSPDSPPQASRHGVDIVPLYQELAEADEVVAVGVHLSNHVRELVFGGGGMVQSLEQARELVVWWSSDAR